MNMMPITAAGRPTQAGSNILSGRMAGRLTGASAMASATSPTMTRLVEVPMMVQTPPKIEAKLIGR